LLPWHLAWPLYHKLAARRWIFRSRVEAAGNEAGRTLGIAAPDVWRHRYRLVLIVDMLDFWISLLQPWRWQRLLQQNGGWPKQRPLVVIGTHWGPAFLTLRSLHRAGLAPHYVIRKAPFGEFRGRRVWQFYILLRRMHLERLFPGKRYEPGGFPRRLIHALRSGECILALIDVPAERPADGRRIQVFGRHVFVQPGIIGPAIRHNAALVTYKLGLDFSTGRRLLEIHPVVEHLNAEQAWQHLADFMARTLEQDPAQWQLWQVADFFQ